MAEQTMNLVQKLAKIRSIADVVKKDKQGYGYTYADITQILANVTGGMKKYGVSLIPSITPGTMEVKQTVATDTKVDKQGRPYDKTTTEMLVTAQMVFKWVNDEDTSDVIEIPWILVGSQGDPSQAFGSALTYCTRYFLSNYFQIAQADSDVDAYRTKQKEAEDAEEQALTKELLGQFDTASRTYLADHQDKKDEVKAFTTRFVKNANFWQIKDSVLAAKLLNDFRSEFLSA